MKKIRLSMIATMIACSSTVFASRSSDNDDNPANHAAALAEKYDLNKPFGFCTMASRSDSTSTYNITGGGSYTYPVTDGGSGVLLLKSNGQDMKSTIEEAIKNDENKIIIFDGSNGDFIVSSTIKLTVSGKTLLGINGTSVKEEAEYNTRKIIIEMTGDQDENYRRAGIFTLNKCENIIIRNLKLVGPGAFDVGGNDLISSTGTKNCWVDHCEFTDGMDGNFDITKSSDFHTVSWCTFSYTKRSYMHKNSNLIGGSDSEPVGFLNSTFAFNWWGTDCQGRTPMGRIGNIHVFNNYYSCTTNENGVNPRINSEFLIEGNYFDKGVTKFYRQRDAIAVTWASDNYIAEATSLPSSLGSPVSVPYKYTVAPVADVPALVKHHAGATLFR